MLRKIKYLLVVAPAFVWVFMPMVSLGEGSPRGKWWQMPQVAEKLDLKEDEKKSLDDLYVQHRRSLIDLKSALEKEKFELDVLLDKETLDEAAIMARFDKLKEARADLSKERFKFLLEVRKTLGNERYQKLKMSFKEFRKKRNRRGGSQGHHGKGGSQGGQHFKSKSE